MKIIVMADVPETYSHNVFSILKEYDSNCRIYDFKKKSKHIASQYGFKENVRRSLVNDIYNIGLKYQDNIWLEQFKKFIENGYYKNKVLLVKNAETAEEFLGLKEIGAVIFCRKYDSKIFQYGVHEMAIDDIRSSDLATIVKGYLK